MLVRVFSVVVAGAAIVSAGLLGLMAVDREPPISVIGGTEVLTPFVKPGGTLEREVTIVQRRKCYTHSDRAIFDSRGTRYLLPPVELRSGNFAPLDEPVTMVLPVPVPENIAPGPARFEALPLYRCNILHALFPIHGPHMVVDFMVVE